MEGNKCLLPQNKQRCIAPPPSILLSHSSSPLSSSPLLPDSALISIHFPFPPPMLPALLPSSPPFSLPSLLSPPRSGPSTIPHPDCGHKCALAKGSMSRQGTDLAQPLHVLHHHCHHHHNLHHILHHIVTILASFVNIILTSLTPLVPASPPPEPSSPPHRHHPISISSSPSPAPLPSPLAPPSSLPIITSLSSFQPPLSSAPSPHYLRPNHHYHHHPLVITKITSTITTSTKP